MLWYKWLLKPIIGRINIMEVIHRYKEGKYPFGKIKEAENTFVQLLKENLTETEIVKLRARAKEFRDLETRNLVRLKKVLKEDTTLHFLYQYHPVSLEMFIASLAEKNQNKISTEARKKLIADLENAVDDVIAGLSRLKFKSDMSINNVAVESEKEDHILKIFIQADFINEDSSNLPDFYLAQKQKLVIQAEEIVQKVFGPELVQSDIEKPNFVISGTKLVFLPNSQKSKHRSSGDKNHSKLSSDSSSLSADPTNEKNKDFCILPIEEEQKFRQIKSPLKPAAKKQQSHKDNENYFKPEQFTKQNTYILEENDYLQSLEEEIVRMAHQKKKQKQALREKEGGEKNMKQSSHLHPKAEEVTTVRKMNSQSQSQTMEKCQTDKKQTQTVQKMKIIKSHQIQIGSCTHPQERNRQSKIGANSKGGKQTETREQQRGLSPKGFSKGSTKQEPQGWKNSIGENCGYPIENNSTEIKDKQNEGKEKNHYGKEKRNSTLNEIIEKISIKTNLGHQQLTHPKKSYHDTSGTEKSFEEENVMVRQKNVGTYHSQRIENNTKNFEDKIRQAKNKAEKILKEYDLVKKG